MKTRILFFDDKPETAKPLREMLIESGYSVVTPKNVEEAFTEINTHRAELIIHAAHHTKTYWAICDGIFTQYPDFPSVHVTTLEKNQIYTAKLKGPFHQRLRPLLPSKDFLRQVRKLVFLGRLARQNQNLKKAISLQNQIDKVISSQDAIDLKIKTVNFFATHFKAKNAYFISAGTFRYFLEEMWKVTNITSGAEKDAAEKYLITAAVPSSETELNQHLTKLAGFLPNGWELRKKRTYLPSTLFKGHEGRSYCFVPIVGSTSQTVLGHVLMVDPALYGDGALEQAFPHLNEVLGRHFEHVFNYLNAKRLSYLDDLTDLYNQRYLRLVLDKEISRSMRSGEVFSVLFMDIDHFKRVNDTRGHLIGSKVLVELSKILHEHIRTTDYGFRYGGDEFILILVGASSDSAMAIAERIRKHVEISEFEVMGEKVKVTLSIGISTYPHHATTSEQIIELADRAMYCGKSKSRNVVYVAS